MGFRATEQTRRVMVAVSVGAVAQEVRAAASREGWADVLAAAELLIEAAQQQAGRENGRAVEAA